MLKNLLYYITALAIGIWMISMLYDSRELHNVKSDIENYHFQVNQMIDKLED